ncbi:MAG: hypothetical protein JSV03_04035 [Planctomycetota bacterium]|nr:MAG: hypothetical protein JSV03_04035 [Planctomycetota bacterium]
MGYDVQFIQMTVPSDISFPINADNAEEFLSNPVPFDNPETVGKKLLEIEGARPGPEKTIDYLGKGMSYARLFIETETIHVENNCGAGDLLKIYNHLLKTYPALLIFDLQSKQLHNASSYEEWWTSPL